MIISWSSKLFRVACRCGQKHVMRGCTSNLTVVPVSSWYAAVFIFCILWELKQFEWDKSELFGMGMHAIGGRGHAGSISMTMKLPLRLQTSNVVCSGFMSIFSKIVP